MLVTSVKGSSPIGGKRLVNKILVMVTNENLDVYKETLGAQFQELGLTSSDDLVFADVADETEASRCNVWVGAPSLIAPLLKSPSLARRPDWVQSTWAGVEPLMEDGMPIDYTLTNMKGVFGGLIAEYTVGHILAYALNTRLHLKSNEAKLWNPIGPKLISGQTIGILGVGSIGSEVARLSKGLGMTTFGYTRSSEDCPHVDQYFHGHHGLMSMVNQVDVLVNIMPNTPDTEGQLNKAVFDKVKDGCIIINAGRGNAICDDDLLHALDCGKIEYAVLDVFCDEPLLVSHPYWQHPKVLVTSHTAAPTDAKDAIAAFVDNCKRFCAGRSLQHQVDFQRGY